MGSKYTEAFDSLRSDEKTKQERVDRILSPRNSEAEITIGQTGAACAVKSRGHIFKGKRGIALITALAIFFAVAVCVPLGIILHNNRGLLGAMNKLNGTFVDMDGVAAFGVWNAPDSSSGSARISDVMYVNAALNASGENGDDQSDGGVNEDWRDDEGYDWESDFDWDPTKSNVLISIGEDGKIEEVVYERINGRGQVRQDVLGNAAAVYVSNGFTYVMYVDDEEWEYWKNGKFAQEMIGSTGLACLHEEAQTVVIHNETGKVFPIKDILPQVNELSGAINYTMYIDPYKDDMLHLRPLYGNLIPQWYNVIYDEQTEKIRYELVLPLELVKHYTYKYNARAVRRDKYGQQYILEGDSYSQFGEVRLTAGMVDLPKYRLYKNSLIFSTDNGLMSGTDGRMYAVDEGKLKVFGENFELAPVEPGIEVKFEGIADDFKNGTGFVHEGICYSLKDGYLYSMFGEVWKVDDDGSLHSRERLKGSFPKFADEGYLMGGEIIAFVDTEQTPDGRYSINGRIAQLKFNSDHGSPTAEVKHIIRASEMNALKRRMIVEQNEGPMTENRGETKYFQITVQDGKPCVDFFAYGNNGGMRLIKPVSEPLVLSSI